MSTEATFNSGVNSYKILKLINSFPFVLNLKAQRIREAVKALHKFPTLKVLE
jgi:hypothetical protein